MLGSSPPLDVVQKQPQTVPEHRSVAGAGKPFTEAAWSQARASAHCHSPCPPRSQRDTRGLCRATTGTEQHRQDAVPVTVSASLSPGFSHLIGFPSASNLGLRVLEV